MKAPAVLILVSVLASCNSSNNVEKPIKSQENKILVVITGRDGKKFFNVAKRIISVKIDYDSVKKKNVISSDTLYGQSIAIPVLDSLNKPKKDSIGNVIYKPEPQYFLIGRDSANWRIQGVDVDSLLKSK